MPIKIEKRVSGPEPLPPFEKEGPLARPSKVLPWWLVFARLIPGNAKEVILGSAMVPFRGYRLSVDPEVAPSFRILDIRVGRNSYSINGHEGAAATLFPPLPNKLTPEERRDYEELLKIKLDAAQVSQNVSLQVHNHTSKPAFFSGILWGYGIEYDDNPRL